MTPTWPNRSVAEYIALLQDSDPRLRRQAAAALWLLDDPRAVAPLIATLQQDTSAEARENAARALAWLGDRRAVAPLTQAVASDADPTVRATATRALTRLGARSHLEGLFLALHNPTPGGLYEPIRALGLSGDARAVAPLIELLQQGEVALGPTLAAALGQLGEPALQPLLRVLAIGNLQARRDAAGALGYLKDTRARPLLQQVFAQEHDHYLRLQCARALQKLGDPEPMKELRDHMTNH